jgi:hypothetical protein
VEIELQPFFAEAQMEHLARECALVERTSPITGFKFLLTFTTGLLHTPNGTLAQLAAFLSSVCKTQVSPQALDERLNVAAVAFMRCCLEKALAMAKRPRGLDGGVLAEFDHVYLIDSTNFDLHPSLREIFKGSGGAASKAAMRIQLVLDYLTGRLYVEIGDAKLCDAPTLQRLVESHVLDLSGHGLFLSDLGYFKTATFQSLKKNEQYFLSKLMFGVTLQDATGAKLDLQALLKKAPVALDLVVTIDEQTYRLVGQKLPDEVINQRLRKANRAAQSKRGGTITDAYRLFLQYALFLTNLPPSYGMDVLFTLYRIRWQIELVFKTWKSILAIHKIRSAKEERVRCEVYGKLILAALSSLITAAAERQCNPIVVSLHRAMQHLRTVAIPWAVAILQGASALAAFVAKQALEIVRLCKKHRQTNKPTIEFRLKQTQTQKTYDTTQDLHIALA